MKRFLYIVVCGIFGSSYGMLQPSVSYHSIVGDEKKQEFYAYPNCRNSEKLQKEIAENTLHFVEASPQNKEKIAGVLIPKYKKIFCVNPEHLLIIEELEEEVSVQSEEELSNEFLKETADSIAYLCDGLPNVALDVQGMYEICGKDKLALLWAMVAYEFRILGAKETIGRLLVGMGC